MDLISVVNNFDEVLKPKIEAFVESVVPMAMALAVGIMFIFVGYKVMKYMANPEDRLDPYTIVNPVLVLAAMALYKPLIEMLLLGPIGLVGDIITEAAYNISGRSLNDFELAFEGAMTHVQSTSEGNPEGSGVYDIVQVNPFLEIIHLLIYFVASVVEGYIIFRQLLTKSIYFILGIFVLPFSLIVGNQKVLSSWFFGYVSVLLWLPMLNIMKMLIILLPVADTSFTNVLLSIVLQVVMIFAILKVPTYANILVSQGSELGKNIGGSMANSMSGGMSGGASAMAGSAGNAMKSMARSARKLASKK